MAIDIFCEECSTPGRVKDELAGKKIKCKSCGAVIRVPDDEPLEEAPVARAPRKPAKRSPAKNSSGGGSPAVAIVAGVVGLALVAGVAVFLMSKRNPAGANAAGDAPVAAGQPATAAPQANATPAAGVRYASKEDVPVPSGWQLVSLDKGGIALAIPSGMVTEGTPEASGHSLRYTYDHNDFRLGIRISPHSPDGGDTDAKRLEHALSRTRSMPGAEMGAAKTLKVQEFAGGEQRFSVRSLPGMTRCVVLPRQIVLFQVLATGPGAALNADLDKILDSVRFTGEPQMPPASASPAATPSVGNAPTQPAAPDTAPKSP